MEHKRLTLFAGHYGSGKTNIAVNYALQLAAEGKKVCVADLDIVNPYFRTADSAAEFEKAGIELPRPTNWCRTRAATVLWTLVAMTVALTPWAAMYPL